MGKCHFYLEIGLESSFLKNLLQRMESYAFTPHVFWSPKWYVTYLCTQIGMRKCHFYLEIGLESSFLKILLRWMELYEFTKHRYELHMSWGVQNGMSHTCALKIRK